MVVLSALLTVIAVVLGCRLSDLEFRIHEATLKDPGIVTNVVTVPGP